MWNEYARVKMLELEAEEARRRGRPSAAEIVLPARRAGPLAPVARFTGRRVRRLGEALESWATPSHAIGSPRH